MTTLEKQIKYREELIEYHEIRIESHTGLRNILRSQIETIKASKEFLGQLGIIDTMAEKLETERRAIIMDISLFPSEYKDMNIKEAIKKYEEEFNVVVIPIDASRQNLQVNSSNTIVQLF